MADNRGPASWGLRSFARAAAFVTCSTLMGACALPRVYSDGTSTSLGATNRGRLRLPAKMPARGEGFVMPRQWELRGNHYGTDELVTALKSVAARVHQRNRNWQLAIADLSPKAGGSSRWHRSHQNGRDVDLILASMDERGRALPPPNFEMIHYGRDGAAYLPSRQATYIERHWSRRRLDVAANWYTVEELLREPGISVQYIFLYARHIESLLEFARSQKRPKELIALAESVLVHPHGVSSHDDHFHIRVFCSQTDKLSGCMDTGKFRRGLQNAAHLPEVDEPAEFAPDSVSDAQIFHASLFLPRG